MRKILQKLSSLKLRVAYPRPKEKPRANRGSLLLTHCNKIRGLSSDILLESCPTCVAAAGRRLDCERSIQLELKHRFRGYLDLLPLGHGLYAGACTCPHARANRGA
jgi:hypothetical protein